jgi:carboxyl-terminal processing protease
LDKIHDALSDRDNFDIIELPVMEQAEYSANFVYYYVDEEHKKIDAELSKDFSSGLPADTAYIKLTEFTSPAETQFKTAMDAFKAAGKKKLVLDLRDNPGGSTVTLGEIAGYLLYDKTAPDKKDINIFVAKYKDGSTEEYKTSGNRYAEYFGGYDAEDKKITVLVNGSSASAAEALSCAILDYGTGTLVGTTTYGKGVMQRTIPLVTIQYYLKVTVATYYSPVRTDFTLHGTGLLTDTDSGDYVEDNFYGYESCRRLSEDEQFKRALEVFGS